MESAAAVLKAHDLTIYRSCDKIRFALTIEVPCAEGNRTRSAADCYLRLKCPIAVSKQSCHRAVALISHSQVKFALPQDRGLS